MSVFIPSSFAKKARPAIAAKPFAPNPPVISCGDGMPTVCVFCTSLFSFSNSLDWSLSRANLVLSKANILLKTSVNLPVFCSFSLEIPRKSSNNMVAPLSLAATAPPPPAKALPTAIWPDCIAPTIESLTDIY